MASNELPPVEFSLFPKQARAFNSPATEILFGGSAGPGKSLLIRIALITWSLAIPGLQCYLFRRKLPDLEKNHLSGPKSFQVLFSPWTAAGLVRFNQSKNFFEIGRPGGLVSRIFLCYAENFNSVVENYQGAEIHVLAIDELTQFPDDMYRYLRARCRMVGVDVPEAFKGRFPKVLCASNPGGIGHNFVKAMFIEPKPPYEIWKTPEDEGGMYRQFIPAVMTDNPALMREDPTFRVRLRGLGSPELVRAMELGDWNIVAGGALDDVWTAETEKRFVLPRFDIPKNWRLNRSYDHGDSHPFSVGWWAEANGEDVTLDNGETLSLPKGSLVRFNEWYGWNGKPDQGLRMLAGEIAREILRREKEMGIAGRVQPGPADTAIFDYSAGAGKSIASEMAANGVTWTRADKSAGSRIAGFQLVRKMLKAAAASPRTEPGLFFFKETCRDGALRTLPTLPLGKTGDDVDTSAEDHVIDEVRYRVYSGGQRWVSVERPI